jgi:D-arabinose 1-dehydrogenase-like Zn-dependent alcohol dehydrogenase
MNDFLTLAARQAIEIDIERVPLAKVNDAMQRLSKDGVKSRLVIDFKTPNRSVPAHRC